MFQDATDPIKTGARRPLLTYMSHWGTAKCTAFLFQLSGDNSLSPKHEPLKSIVLEVYRSNNVNELLRVHTAPDPSGYSSQKCVGEKRFGDF